MSDITKFTKAQLINIIEESEENKFGYFKSELGLPYHTDEDWVDYIKSLQEKIQEYQKEQKQRMIQQRKELFSRS